MASHQVTLYTIAHGRSGDKGDAVNVGIIARAPEFYAYIKEHITADRVGSFLRGMAKGPVERFEMDNLEALNFLVHGALGGGGSIGMQTDAQGKTYAGAALRMSIELTEDLYNAAVKHWGGKLPHECFETIDGRQEYHHIRTDVVEGRILHVRLNRSGARNALTCGFLQELADALRPDPARKAVVISGEGKDFCAGMDLGEMLSYKRSYERFSELGQALYAALEGMIRQPCPVISAIHGNALGGGAAIALSSDIIVADDSAKFGFPETKIGFIPGIVSSLALRRLPGQVARELLLTGRRFDVEEAHRLGMVSFRTASDPAAKALDVARGLLRDNSGLALRHSKNLINLHTDTELLRDMQWAVNLFAGRAMEDAFQTAMAAFAGKQPVDWSAE